MAMHVIKSALSYITPSPLTALLTIKNSYAKAHTPNDPNDLSKGVHSALTAKDTGIYNGAKITLLNVVAGAVAAVALYTFGNKLGNNYTKVAALTAVVLSGSFKDGALLGAFVLFGKDAMSAFKARAYTSFAKDAGFAFAALLASSDATRGMFYHYVKPYIITKS